MPDKIINVKINVKEINKDWLYLGEKGVYLNATILYNEEKNDKGQNGMVVQDVPSSVYKNDKSIRGPILGNCSTREKKKEIEEAKPGVESGSLLSIDEEAFDDLPF